jgi:hypothetical protein
MKLLTAVALLSVLLIGVSSAYGAGLYLGGSIGASYANYNWDDVDLDDFEISGADFAWKLFGGYKVIPFLSFEGGYRNLGKVTDDVKGIVYGSETKGWDVEAMGILPLGIAHLWIKAGYFFWSSEGTWGDDTQTSDGSDFMWGLGGDLSLIAIALRLEWESFEMSDAKHLSMFSGGVTFGF